MMVFMLLLTSWCSQASAYVLTLNYASGIATKTASCQCDNGATSTVGPVTWGSSYVKELVDKLGPLCLASCKGFELVDSSNRLAIEIANARAGIQSIGGAATLDPCQGSGAFVLPAPPGVGPLQIALQALADASKDPKTLSAGWKTLCAPLRDALGKALLNVKTTLNRSEINGSRVDKHPTYYSVIDVGLLSAANSRIAPAEKLFAGFGVILGFKPTLKLTDTKGTPVFPPNAVLASAMNDLTKDTTDAQKDRAGFNAVMLKWCTDKGIGSPTALAAAITAGNCGPINFLNTYISRLQADMIKVQKALALGPLVQQNSANLLITAAQNEIIALRAVRDGAKCSTLGTPTPTPKPKPKYLVVAKPIGPGDGQGDNNVYIYGGGINCGNIPDQNECTNPEIIAGTDIILRTHLGANISNSKWTGACAGSSAPTCTVKVGDVESVGLTFTAKPKLTLTRWLPDFQLNSGVSGVQYSISGSGLECTYDSRTYNYPTDKCVGWLIPGTQVTLIAKLSNNVSMDKWTGACSGSALTCQLTMDGDKTVGLAFKQRPKLTLNLPMGGSGDILHSGGKKCGTGGSECENTEIPFGTQITLTANLGSNTTIDKWTGDCAGSALTCSLKMDANKTVGLAIISKVGICCKDGNTIEGLWSNKFNRYSATTTTEERQFADEKCVNNLLANPDPKKSPCVSAVTTPVCCADGAMVQATGSFDSDTSHLTSTERAATLSACFSHGAKAGGMYQNFYESTVQKFPCLQPADIKLKECEIAMDYYTLAGTVHGIEYFLNSTIGTTGKGYGSGNSTEDTNVKNCCSSGTAATALCRTDSLAYYNTLMNVESRLTAIRAPAVIAACAPMPANLDAQRKSKLDSLIYHTGNVATHKAAIAAYVPNGCKTAAPTPTPTPTPKPTTPTPIFIDADAGNCANYCAKVYNTSGGFGSTWFTSIGGKKCNRCTTITKKYKCDGMDHNECETTEEWTKKMCPGNASLLPSGLSCSTNSGGGGSDEVDANGDKCGWNCDNCVRCVSLGAKYKCKGMAHSACNSTSWWGGEAAKQCSPACPSGQECQKKLFGWKCKDTTCNVDCGTDQICVKQGWYKKANNSGWRYFANTGCVTSQQFAELTSSTSIPPPVTTIPSGYNADGTLSTPTPTPVPTATPKPTPTPTPADPKCPTTGFTCAHHSHIDPQTTGGQCTGCHQMGPNNGSDSAGSYVKSYCQNHLARCQ